jgi:succinate dehydrogenase/fumarate reductase flavoprotein subunit
MQVPESRGTDRRSFLKGAVLVGAGAAATGLVAACSPSSSGGGASGEASTPSGGGTEPATGWSWSTPPAAIADADISETIDTEIAVVGAGISGCAAACRASQLGAKVVVVEKQGFPSSRGGHYGAYQTNAMTRAGLTNDPMDQIASEWLRFEGNRAKQKIIYRYLERSSEVINWLEDYSTEFEEGGLIIAPIITHYVGPYYYEHIGTHVIFGPGSMMEGQGYPGNENMINAPVYFMWKQAEAKGAQFIFNTPAEQLVQDSSGRVTGVVAKKEDGTYVKINASKGVLLASGDFSGDEEMREAYCDPISLKCDSFSYTPVGANTGDGQKMAMWTGAHMFLGEHCSPSMMHLIRYSLLCFGFMYVNTSGRRFMNEDTWIQAKSIHILQQPGDNSFAYSIFDADYQQQVVDSLQYGGGQFWDNMSHMVGQPFDWGTAEDPYSPAGAIAAGLENGTVFQADTIEDLASQMGVDAAVLQEEVDKYNQWYDGGVDEDYHKRVELLTPIRTAPFYAIKFGPSNLVHPNGVEVNELMQVLDEKLDPIPGLYASGNASGGRYAVDYPVVMNGNSHGTAMTFGYLVGEDLANA